MKIVYVDGFKIRNTLDDDFAEVHRNLSRFSRFENRYYIPQNEIWVDHIFKKSGEVDFLLEVDEAIEEYFRKHPEEIDNPNNPADKRKWRSWLNAKMCFASPKPEFFQRKEKIDDLTIIYVDGRLVRRYLDCQFFYGGHDLVYSYISQNEIWLDTVTDPQENKYFLVHEKIERKLMSQGKTYDIAHRFALATDMEARVNDGVGAHPGDANYHWTGLSNEEIIKKHYVITDEITN